MASANLIGQTISHYQILELIGEGGMGLVYKAEDTKLHRPVALKFLSSHAVTDRRIRERFVREAQAAAAIDHPSICTVYEIDEDRGRTFIAMAYIAGQDLQQRIDEGPLPIGEAVRITEQVAEGLQAAHGEGVVHRDIKPGNVILTTQGRVKIVDFGLAQLRGRSRLTREGTTVGTVAYMSPEQLTAEPLDHRTDIWSLGVMLYEMIVGRLPFEGDSEDRMSRLILNAEPKPLTGLRTGVPITLERLARKAVAKRPEERYQHMDDLLVDLRAARREAESESRDELTLPAKAAAGPAAEPTAPSVAVLPFAQLSAAEQDEGGEYFADGLTEELINALSQVEGLRVVCRTSVFQFKGKSEDAGEIGRKLRVSNLLEGSVRRSGDRLRISAQLINAADGYQLWSKRFDRKMEDVFQIQDEISGAIVKELRAKLASGQPSARVNPGTEDVEAYQLFLRGRYHLNKLTHEGLRKSIDYFQQALDLGSGYAQAHAGLAAAYAYLAIEPWEPPRETMPLAKAEAAKALEIDDTLAYAYATSALYRHWYEWDRAGAAYEYELALGLDPNAAPIHAWYARLLAQIGRGDEAVAEAQRAVDLDPVSLDANRTLCTVLLLSRRYDQVIEQSLETIDLDPKCLPAYWPLAVGYMRSNQDQKALATLLRASRLGGGDPWSQGVLAWALARQGRDDEARRILDSLLKLRGRAYCPALAIAVAQIGLDDKDAAFQWFETAVEERDGSLGDIGAHVACDPLRADPRFQDLLKKVGLPA